MYKSIPLILVTNSLQSLSVPRGGPKLDIDGLTVFVDPVQARMAALEAKYNRDIHRLETELMLYRTILHHSVQTGQTPNVETLVSEGHGH